MHRSAFLLLSPTLPPCLHRQCFDSSNLLLQEHHHAAVLSEICTLVLGPNTIVLRECLVGESELPHGRFDLVAGSLNVKDQSYAVAVIIDGEECELKDPVGIETKTPKALRKGAISELIQLVDLQ